MPQYGNAGDYHLWKSFSNLSSLKVLILKLDILDPGMDKILKFKKINILMIQK